MKKEDYIFVGFAIVMLSLMSYTVVRIVKNKKKQKDIENVLK